MVVGESTVRTDRSWTLRLRGGERIVVPATLSSYSTCMFLEREDWFEVEVEFIRKLITPGTRALDIGANLGFYTLTIARAAGREGYVWAFEPDASTASRLRQSIEANELTNVRVERTALGGTSGVVKMTSELGAEFNTIRRSESQTEKSSNVPMVTLDEYTVEAGVGDVSFLKLDVEGMEADVVHGGRRFLNRESPLVMAEFHHNGHLHTDMLSEFRDLGYLAWRYSPAIGQLVAVTTQQEFPWLNLFFAKRSRAANLASRNLLLLSDAANPTRQAGAFEGFFSSIPFGRRWAEEVGVVLELASDPVSAPYLAALDLYAQSREPGEAAAVRFSCLRESFRHLQALYSPTVNHSIALSFVRVACDLGLHGHARAVLSEVLEPMKRGAQLVVPLPFLPVSERFELDPGRGRLGAACVAMTLEAYIRFQFGTAWRAPPECRAMLKHIISLGFGTPELERARQIGEIIAGHQSAPIRTDILEEGSATTLNWHFWRDGAAYEAAEARARSC